MSHSETAPTSPYPRKRPLNGGAWQQETSSETAGLVAEPQNAVSYLCNPALLLEELDLEQRQVAQHQHGALCVLAGAGTGKTRAITYRIAYGVHSAEIDPENVLALTFTRKAAQEMRQRLQGLGVPLSGRRSLGVNAQTFHSTALAMLRHFWPQVMGGSVPEIINKKGSLLKSAGLRMRLDLSKGQIQELAAEIEWAKVRLLNPSEYLLQMRQTGVAQRVSGLSHQRVADLMDAYEDAKIEREVLDYQDILLLMAGMLDSRDDIVRAVRKRYQYFVVDEYQDVSPLQNYLLLQMLGHRRDLAVVGDAAQTIYSFAGAEATFLTGFTQVYPEATVIELVRDYRSTPQIVELANQVLGGAKDDEGKALEGTVRLVSQKDDGPAVQWFAAEDDETEATEIARRIKALHQGGVLLSDIAILYRANTQAQLLTAELARLGIPAVKKDCEGGDAVIASVKADRKAIPAVTLSTLHSSKGLEWDTVFLAGLSEGLLPISYALESGHVEEERRLLYVGITRARQQLTMSYARNRRAQKEDARKVSRFLSAAWPRTGKAGRVPRHRGL